MKGGFYWSTYLVVFVLLFYFLTCSTFICAQYNEVTLIFEVDMRKELRKGRKIKNVGLRGNTPPLSWVKSFPLEDKDGDGTFSGSMTFDRQYEHKFLEYKFICDAENWELKGEGNRLRLIHESMDLVYEDWNMPRILEPIELEALIIAPEGMEEDYEILRATLETMHPGLYKYISKEELNIHFRDLRKACQKEHTLEEAYLLFSEFIAKIQCGHTYPNFWNQPSLIRYNIFDRADKLPFTFRIVDGLMLVTHNASEEDRLARGSEVTAINDILVADILKRLKPFVKADGGNDAKRFNALQVNSYGTYEAFDIYFPLLFPPEDGIYKVESIDMTSGEAFQSHVLAISRQQRQQTLAHRYKNLPLEFEDLWAFKFLNRQTAYLKLTTFGVWETDWDWKGFLKEVFNQLKKSTVEHLIIDVRDNEGGSDEVVVELLTYLVKQPLQVKLDYEPYMTFRRIPSKLQSYVNSWDDFVSKMAGQLKYRQEGYYSLPPTTFRIEPAYKAFEGNSYLMVNAANSSATFYLAMIAQKYNIASVIGEETGGNLQGINSGAIYFLRLPNSNIEIDIPIIGNRALTMQENKGITPDFVVTESVEDVFGGFDSPMKAILEIVRKSK